MSQQYFCPTENVFFLSDIVAKSVEHNHSRGHVHTNILDLAAGQLIPQPCRLSIRSRENHTERVGPGSGYYFADRWKLTDAAHYTLWFKMSLVAFTRSNVFQKRENSAKLNIAQVVKQELIGDLTRYWNLCSNDSTCSCHTI